MNRIWGLALVACLAIAAPAAAVEFAPASQAEAAAILSASDEVTAVWTHADTSIRARRTEGATVADVQAIFAAAALPWSEAEAARLHAMAARHQAAVDALQAWLPDAVLFIKNTDAVDAGLPHTRANAIVFGPDLPGSDEALDKLFFHELFHILSRHSAARRDELYSIIGFERCTTLDLPADVRARLFTNPDAPVVSHAAQAHGEPADIYLTPLLTAQPGEYDPSIPHLFDYFELVFVKLRRDAAGHCAAVIEDGAMANFGDQGAPLLFARAGRNTDYMLHPEEMVADNFAQLMTGRTDAPDAWVQERLAALLGVAPRP